METGNVEGAAQNPAHEYLVVRRFPAGHRVARRNAVENGVEIGDNVNILRTSDSAQLSGSNAHASYLSLRGAPNDLVTLDQLFPGGRVNLFIHRVVFLSDESIVAHITHELYEVEGLRQAFSQAGGGMTLSDLNELVRAGNPGNLHSGAWDAANQAVDLMRQSKSGMIES